MQEKKVDKNTFAEKSEDVWSAMQEVRLGPGLPLKFAAQISRKLEHFLLSQHCKNQISLPLCKIFRISAQLDFATILI